MFLKMKTIRLECGGCPTTYSGQTVDGYDVDMRLRHGGLTIKVNGHAIVSESISHLDGICSLDDFKFYAGVKGHVIDTDTAAYSSQIQEDNDRIEEMFADQVWLTFVKEFESPSLARTFKKGETIRVNLDSVEILLKSGFVTLDSKRDGEKFAKHLLKQSS